MNVGTVSGSALRTHVLSHMHANAQANLTRVPHPCTSARHTSIFQRVMHPMLPSLQGILSLPLIWKIIQEETPKNK